MLVIAGEHFCKIVPPRPFKKLLCKAFHALREDIYNYVNVQKIPNRPSSLRKGDRVAVEGVFLFFNILCVSQYCLFLMLYPEFAFLERGVGKTAFHMKRSFPHEIFPP